MTMMDVKDLPLLLETTIEELVTKSAKRLYYKHINLDEDAYDFLWGQCSEDYRQAWKVIAEADHEDFIRELRESYEIMEED
ncbi:hypothetical protein NVP1101O_065 [Vibrio phage 1.101.O._10N.261.45.C6]|nr:hypothetical protein NVP1101O_065 [Vibrio phage 1.101.O._10N.261.45.C6]